MSPDPFEPHLRRAEELFGAGDVRQAGQIWQAILKRQPGHAQALQGLVRVKEALQALPRAEAPPPSRGELDKLLREASQLWDLGVPEDAIAKWERVLHLDPGNAEAQSFIDMVRREQAEAEAKAAAKAARPPESLNQATTALPTLTPPGEDPRLRQGQHQLDLGHFEEALWLFQQLLAEAPGHPQAAEGAARARAGLEAAQASAPAPAPPAPPPPRLTPASRPAAGPGQGVALPASVLAPAGRRLGLDIPPQLQAIVDHPLVQSPAVWAGVLGTLLVSTLGLSYWRQASRDRQLRADVDQAIRSALGPVVQAARVVDLAEAPDAILAEAKGALSEDPLRAYHRAKELLRRAPQDAPAAQLLEAARTALPCPVPEESWEAKAKAGDLDGALALVTARLRNAPEDPDLLRRATALLGAQAAAKASKDDFASARECLQRARALAPQDPAWQARLHLLDRIAAQPKAEQSGWISLLAGP